GLFEAQVARTPDAVAVVSGGVAVSYGELEVRANRLARLLLGRGVGAGRRVALVLPRSVDLVVALLAVLKSGAAYVPVDPEYPVERIAYVVEDASPVVVLALAGTAGRVPEGGVERLVLDSPEVVEELAALSGDVVVDGERGGALPAGLPAYVLHTSGSTGRPKGVVVSHG
ncbi:AMP-binding protein, partial [Kitasatospora nipponensis]|uniref:AMP-binding protein n=1 Tax=Kitasatospora nipponensis TaxID=258049 RepID=UPI0031DD7EAD